MTFLLEILHGDHGHQVSIYGTCCSIARNILQLHQHSKSNNHGKNKDNNLVQFELWLLFFFLHGALSIKSFI